MNRVKAGYCLVPNPFNPQQVSHISLSPQDVDVIVFWTRNPRPLFLYLDELDARGYRYYFTYTLLGYPQLIDPHSPPVEVALDTFVRLSGRLGPERLIWRYDPLFFSQLTPPSFHQENYARLSEALHSLTHRSVISVLTPYKKIRKRMEALAVQGANPLESDPQEQPWFSSLLSGFANIAAANGMQVFSCASKRDLAPYGVRPGKCVDDDYIKEVFGLDVSHTKDPGQRPACGCVVSRDIGIYDTCLFGCSYCYATGSFEKARTNNRRHDPQGEALVSGYN